MGISSSKTVLNNISNTMTSIATTNTNKCSGTVSNINSITCPGLKADSLIISQGNTGALNFSCIQSNFTNNEVEQTMVDKVAQNVEAAIGTFGVGITDSSAYTTYARNVATNIVNVSSNTCLAQIAQGNVIDCSGAQVDKVVNLSQQNFANNLASCVQSNSTKNKLVQDFTSAIEQSAKSKVSGITGLVVLIIIVLVIALGAYLFFKSGGGMSSDGTPRSGKKWLIITLVIIVVLVAGWFLTAYFLKWWPFQKNDFEQVKNQ
jgi:hypothetical protein